MEINESVGLMKALGDSSRLLIVNSLMEKPQYLEELAKRLNLAESTVSFHMKKLENSGLVYRQKDQYYVIFHIRKEVFDRTLKDIVSFNNMEKPVQDKRIVEYRNKVISVYFRNGKLLKIPSQHKKKLIILEEIIKLFEKGRVYKEKEVDSIISEINEDYCSIRRYFIDENMMHRDRGNYRINPEYINNSHTEIPAFRAIKERLPKEELSEIEQKMDKTKRKEIINTYKQTRPQMGVYQLKNLKNGKIFVGSGKNLNAKRNLHMIALDSWKMHEITELQEAWNELGDKGVAFEVLEILEPKKDESSYNYTKDLAALEARWLEKLQPYGERGYNRMKVKK